jgi:AGCS family alanine or glycine:cation symporter
MDSLLKIVQTVNAYLSDYILIVLLLGTGLFFSFKTKFVQIRCFGEGMRKVFGNFTMNGKNTMAE